MTVRNSTAVMHVAGDELPILTDAQVEAATRGQMRVYWNAQPLPLRLRPEDRAALKASQTRGYVVAASGRTGLTQAYFYWCAAHGRPFVRVRPGRPYAWVTLDLRTSREPLDDAVMQTVVSEMRAAAVRSRWRFGGARCFGDGLACESPRVPPEEAEALAARIVTLVTHT